MIPSEMTKFVYGLFELDTGELRYIGQTLYPKERFSQHSSGAFAATFMWVRELKNKGQSLYMRVLARPVLENADLSETDFIRDAILRGARLLNREILW